jgi:hypothetical protein
MLNRILTLSLTLACIVLGVLLLRQNKKPSPPPTGDIVTWSGVFPEVNRDMAVLARRVGDLKLDGVPLEEALLLLCDRTKLNITANWSALQGQNASPQEAVHVHLSNPTLGEALQAIINSLQTPGRGTIAYDIEDGIVTVTSAELASKFTTTEYLNIRALNDELTRFNGSIGRPTGPPSPNWGRTGPTWEDVMEEIVKLITDMVAADSWRDAGGTVGSIREIGGILVITQTPENLQAIRDLLSRLHQVTQTNAFAGGAGATPHLPMVFPAHPAAAPGNSALLEYINIRPLLAELQKADDAGAAHHGMNAADPQPTAQELADKVAEVIIDSIDPQSWIDQGGDLGTIHNLGGVLIIVQTPDNLKAIHAMLQTLHEALAQK